MANALHWLAVAVTGVGVALAGYGLGWREVLWAGVLMAAWGAVEAARAVFGKDGG